MSESTKHEEVTSSAFRKFGSNCFIKGNGRQLPFPYIILPKFHDAKIDYKLYDTYCRFRIKEINKNLKQLPFFSSVTSRNWWNSADRKHVWKEISLLDNSTTMNHNTCKIWTRRYLEETSQTGKDIGFQRLGYLRSPFPRGFYLLKTSFADLFG